MAYIPPDLIYNVFSRLPVESLFRFRCVCKNWRAIIDDPLLREMHTHRFMLDADDDLNKQSDSDSDSDSSSVSFLLLARFGKQKFHEFHFGEYFDEDESLSSSSSRFYKVTKPIKYIHFNKHDTLLYTNRSTIVGGSTSCNGFHINTNNIHTQCTEGSTIVGSCNGLVCFATFISGKYNLPVLLYVFNPVTKQYFRIPNFDKMYYVHLSMNGFGYLPSTKEYKVVRIYYEDYSPARVEVYTLGSGEWRSIGHVPPMFMSLVRLPGVLVNEALHWIDDDGKIALFDLATEEFRMVSSPSPLTLVPDNAHYYELGVMGGRSLYVIEHNIHKSVDIWVMDNNVEGSWTKEFCIPIREGSCCPSHDEFDYDWEEFDDYNFVTITKSGKVLLWYNRTGLVSYDPKTEKFTLHGDYKADPCWFEAVFHKKSFVSLKALGEDSIIMAEAEV